MQAREIQSCESRHSRAGLSAGRRNRSAQVGVERRLAYKLEIQSRRLEWTIRYIRVQARVQAREIQSCRLEWTSRDIRVQGRVQAREIKSRRLEWNAGSRASSRYNRAGWSGTQARVQARDTIAHVGMDESRHSRAGSSMARVQALDIGSRTLFSGTCFVRVRRFLMLCRFVSFSSRIKCEENVA